MSKIKLTIIYSGVALLFGFLISSLVSDNLLLKVELAVAVLMLLLLLYAIDKRSSCRFLKGKRIHPFRLLAIVFLIAVFAIQYFFDLDQQLIILLWSVAFYTYSIDVVVEKLAMLPMPIRVYCLRGKYAETFGMALAVFSGFLGGLSLLWVLL